MYPWHLKVMSENQLPKKIYNQWISDRLLLKNKKHVVVRQLDVPQS